MSVNEVLDHLENMFQHLPVSIPVHVQIKQILQSARPVDGEEVTPEDEGED